VRVGATLSVEYVVPFGALFVGLDVIDGLDL
jgi:hypothetical protein